MHLINGQAILTNYNVEVLNMNKPILVIMAAGMGSRYGGCAVAIVQKDAV